jgi:hypothetical protein
LANEEIELSKEGKKIAGKQENPGVSFLVVNGAWWPPTQMWRK